MPNPYISGTGFYLPSKVVTNDDLSKYMDTTDEWIQERTGIKERRYVCNNEKSSDLAAFAIEQALENAQLSVKDIDFIIFATSTPDFHAPGSGCIIQEKMGFNEIGALDIRVQCAGFLYGLSIAEQYIRTGSFNNILLIGAEVQSPAMNLTTEGRDTAVIFGDGAGAVVISATNEDRGILSTHMHSDGKHIKELWLESPGTRISHEDIDKGKHFLQMNGKEVFRNAVTRFPEVINECLEKNKLNTSDINMFIPHQANLRITQMVQKKLKLEDNQVYSNIEKYGNTTAATIPIALSEVVASGKISKGDLVILAAFGSGFSWASAAIKW